ncbi:ankyrin repeat domain-containing protein [Legionella sp. WA2022007384]
MKRYYFNNSKNYIDSHEQLSVEQIEQLKEIMSFFPYHGKNNWLQILESFHPEKYPSKLVHMAANAFDDNGHTMLGLVCEYGKNVEIVQRLIDMGANPDIPDHNMKKLPLHRAINNQLSSSNRDSLDAVAVVQCLLNNGANTKNACFQNSTPLFFALSQQFHAAAKLIKDHILSSRSYAILQESLLSGDTYSLKQALNNTDGLASFITTVKGWSPVFAAIHQSYAHQKTLRNLTILKKHHVEFNNTFYIKTYSGIPIYCAVNPIAYLLLRGGDSRLIGALIKHGADPEHPSIAVVKKIIELNPNHKAFNYAVQNDSNPYDVNARTMLDLFESKFAQGKQKSKTVSNSTYSPGLFETKVNKSNEDTSISDEELAASIFGQASFTAKRYS